MRRKRIDFMAEVARIERENPDNPFARGLLESMSFYMAFGKGRRKLRRGGRYARRELAKIKRTVAS